MDVEDTTWTEPSAHGRTWALGYRAPRQYREDAPDDERTLRSLIKQLSHEVTTLARQEVALAKAEISEKAAIAARNARYLAIGAAVGYAGFLVLLGALAAGIGAWMAAADVSPGIYLWLAPLIVALVMLAVGGGLVLQALDAIRREGLAPKRTAGALRDAKDFVKEKVT
jgi:hypothetical protein